MDWGYSDNKSVKKSFKTLLTKSVNAKGAFSTLLEAEDLRAWIRYIDDKTPFSSIAGSILTAALKEEYSPAICSSIASKANFPSPSIRRLDENLFLLDLYQNKSLSYTEYIASLHCSTFDILQRLYGQKASFIGVGEGALPISYSKKIKKYKGLKAFFLYPKGSVCNLDSSTLYLNGGNFYPIEVEGGIKKCQALLLSLARDASFIKQNDLILADNTNILSLICPIFFYIYAFSRIKNLTCHSIYYAQKTADLSAIVSAMYAWSFALPLNGIITPAEKSVESLLDIKKEEAIDAFDSLALRANYTRLKSFFTTNDNLAKYFIFPRKVTEEEVRAARKTLLDKYAVFSSTNTAESFAAYQKIKSERKDANFCTVLLALEDPNLEAFLHGNDKKKTNKGLTLPIVKRVGQLKEVINELGGQE